MNCDESVEAEEIFYQQNGQNSLEANFVDSYASSMLNEMFE